MLFRFTFKILKVYSTHTHTHTPLHKLFCYHYYVWLVGGIKIKSPFFFSVCISIITPFLSFNVSNVSLSSFYMCVCVHLFRFSYTIFSINKTKQNKKKAVLPVAPYKQTNKHLLLNREKKRTQSRIQ